MLASSSSFFSMSQLFLSFFNQEGSGNFSNQIKCTSINFEVMGCARMRPEYHHLKRNLVEIMIFFSFFCEEFIAMLLKRKSFFSSEVTIIELFEGPFIFRKVLRALFLSLSLIYNNCSHSSRVFNFGSPPGDKHLNVY